jgi:hypothetical protein
MIVLCPDSSLIIQRSALRPRVPPVARQVYNREQTPEFRGKGDAEVLKVR